MTTPTFPARTALIRSAELLALSVVAQRAVQDEHDRDVFLTMVSQYDGRALPMFPERQPRSGSGWTV